MFQAGDRLLYTGKYKNCLTGVIPKGSEVVVEATASGAALKGGSGKDAYTYVRHVTHGRWAVYNADLELLAVEPEPYEAWFV